MAHSVAPKLKVREWMQQRRREPKPPQDMKEIRRQLGWELVEIERDKKVYRY